MHSPYGGCWCSGIADIPRESTEPPPYKYPPVLLHPTVYFTAVLSSLDTFYGLTQDEQIQQVQASVYSSCMACSPCHIDSTAQHACRTCPRNYHQLTLSLFPGAAAGSLVSSHKLLHHANTWACHDQHKHAGEGISGWRSLAALCYSLLSARVIRPAAVPCRHPAIGPQPYLANREVGQHSRQEC